MLETHFEAIHGKFAGVILNEMWLKIENVEKLLVFNAFFGGASHII